MIIPNLQTTSSVTSHYGLVNTSSSFLYAERLEKILEISLRDISTYETLYLLISRPVEYLQNVNYETVSSAVSWFLKLRLLVSKENLQWPKPLINVCDSEIIFEWWVKNKKLSVYVSETNIEYIQVWGANIDTEMKEGVFTTYSETIDVWRWLLSENQDSLS